MESSVFLGHIDAHLRDGRRYDEHFVKGLVIHPPIGEQLLNYPRLATTGLPDDDHKEMRQEVLGTFRWQLYTLGTWWVYFDSATR